MKSIRITFVLLAVSFAMASFASPISKEYSDFVTGPAHFALSKEEVSAWKNVRTNEEAKAFIDRFFARRDPTPGTPANEYREGFEERIRIANQNFGAALPGAMTDRGRVFILLGAPTRIRKSQQALAASTIQTGPRTGDAPSTIQSYSPKEIWIYEQAKTPFDIGQPVAEIGFIDQYGNNDFKIERTAQTNYVALFESVAGSFLTGDGSVPQLAATQTTTASAPAAVVLSESLRAAIDQARGAADPPKTIFATWGEFVTAEGEHFVPVQLYLPEGEGLAAEAGYTFFGTVENAEGAGVVTFEEPATLLKSHAGFYVARSLTVPPGTYRGIFGLAKEVTVMSSLAVPMEVRGIDPAAPAPSMLILSNDVQPLAEAQEPTDPFAFGGLKVVPKSDGLFRKSDELWYFFEMRNPGLDPETKQPRLMLRLSVIGKTNEGRGVRLNAPSDLMAAQELKGVPGHWAVGQSIPLATFHPGSYTLTARVTDETLGTTYTLEQPFRIVE
ncbi:MAG TPA: GWxTD domain-containing protein [Thermoanaerobaculia bacterium]